MGIAPGPATDKADGGLPNLAAQTKVYFTDPLFAQLPHLRDEQPAPDPSQISEQQLGLALALNLAAGDSGRFADFSAVMYARSATGREVDFCGRRLGPVAFEAKYTDRSLGRESQTMRAMFNGRGVLATRAQVAEVDSVRAWPAGLIALLLGD